MSAVHAPFRFTNNNPGEVVLSTNRECFTNNNPGEVVLSTNRMIASFLERVEVTPCTQKAEKKNSFEANLRYTADDCPVVHFA